ncbi:hypothetical protein ABBQ32_013617 [Trebouxia sp. C0010 RCD-2024]
MVVNPRTIGWSTTSCDGSRGLERAGHSATTVGNDIYVIGGRHRESFCKDVCKLDTASGKWGKGFMRPPFEEKAYHTTTLVGSDIWVVGGSDDRKMSSCVHTLNTNTLRWQTAKLRGDIRLLQRAAHGCVLHPSIPNALLIFGGYGIDSTSNSGKYQWLNDLVVLETDSLEFYKEQPRGIPPTVRGYHSFDALAQRCFVIGGRTTSETLLVGDQFLHEYDAAAKQWLAPKLLPHTPVSRSNHSSVVVSSNQLLICGGAGGGGRRKRMDDTQVLRLGSRGLSWSRLPIPPLPTGRSAQAVVKCNSSIYMLGGYGGDGGFPSDVLTLPLKTFAASVANQQAALPEPVDAAVEDAPTRCEATCWKIAKRSRPAGAVQQGQPPKRQRALAPAGPADSAQVPHHHPLQTPLQQPGPGAAHAMPALHPHSSALQAQVAVDRSRGMGCGLVSGAPASGGGVYGGCAFSEAATMAATVTRLEAELAHAKGALADRAAGEEAWQRQRRALEADVARFHAEAISAEQRYSASSKQCAELQRQSEEQVQRLQAAQTASADANSRAAAAVATAGELQGQLSVRTRQRDEYAKLAAEREEAAKACEAEAAKARGALRQERLEWEKSDSESRSALHSLREEWRMLQDTNAQLHATVTRLTKALQGAEGKVREGVNSLAEARRQAGQQQEQGSRALQAQQAATQAAQQQLQAAQARINTAETAQKKLEVQVSELQPHAAKLQGSLQDSQAKLKAATTELANVRADLAQTKDVLSDSTKHLEREGQHLANHANELLKLIARQRSHSPALAPS